MTTPFHLGLYTMPPLTHHSMATWRHKLNIPEGRGFAFDRAKVWQYVGQLAESAKFDFFFSADTEGVYRAYQDSIDPAIKYGAQVPVFDQTITLSFVAASTANIGVISTLSINGTPPYVAARKFATLDHLSGGRAGWNVVTAFQKSAAQNLGNEDQLDHDARYDRAEEYMEACYQLWNSWEEDAIVFDKEGGTFAEPKRVQEINFNGEHYRTRGPLNVHRSPQNGPLIVQAGSSVRGISFAAKHAELVFTIQPFRDGMKQYHDELKTAMHKDYGRDPDTCKVMFSFQPVVGETEEIARAKADLHNAMVPLEGGMTIFSGHTTYDWSVHDRDKPLKDLNTKVPGIQGLVDMYTRVADGRNVTLADVARAHGRGVGSPQVVGTPEQIADWMQETMEYVGGDGFMLTPLYLPGSLEDFADLVVPELRRRGLVREDYLAGGTLRDNLLAF